MKKVFSVLILVMSINSMAFAITVDVSTGSAFSRNIFGQHFERMFPEDGYSPELVNGTMARSLRCGGPSSSFDWKKLTGTSVGLPSDHTWYSLLALESARDNHSVPMFEVNMRGIGEYQAGTWVWLDTSAATTADLAADWVRYCNIIVPNYSIGDTLSAADQTLMNEIIWSPKMLPIGSPATPKVIYWEIGNEEDSVPFDHGYTAWTGATYTARYKAITNAMKAVDPSIKTVASISRVAGTADTGNVIRTLLQDPTAQVDGVAYHDYQNLGQYWNPDVLSGTYTTDLASLEQAFRSLYAGTQNRYTETHNVIAADRPLQVGQIKVFNTEWNPMGWNYSSSLQSQAAALATAESLFAFANIGIDGGVFYAFSRTQSTVSNRTTMPVSYSHDKYGTKWPVYYVHKAMIEHAGDTLVNRWVGTGGQQNVRLYVTKDSRSGKIAVWGLNWDNASDATLSVSLQNTGTYVKKTLMWLGEGSLAAPTTTLFTMNDDNAAQYRNTVKSYWHSQDVTTNPSYSNLSSFSLPVPHASITLLVLETSSSHYCGDSDTVYNSMDINRDCVVSFKDFAYMAEAWQNHGIPSVLAPNDTTPPGNVSSFSCSPATTLLGLSWNNPTDSDFSGVVIVRRAGQAPSGLPTNGTTYSVGNSLAGGTVVYAGNGTIFNDTLLTQGITYYYAAFSHDLHNNYASGASTNGTLTPVTVLASWDFQWVAPTVHQSTVGNPRIDADLNQWSIYSTSQSVTWGPVAWTLFHGYISGGYKDWLDPTEQNDFYVVYLQDNGHGYTGNDTHSALAFKPGVAGHYSVYGGLYFRFVKGNNVAGLLSVGIKNGSAYTELYQTATTAEATIMLSAIPALQSITLGVGDEIVVINEASWWTGVQMYISSDTGGHVGIAHVSD